MRRLTLIGTAIAVALAFGAPARAENSTAFYRILLAKKEASIEDAIQALARLKGFDGVPGVEKSLAYLYERKVAFRGNIVDVKNRSLTKGNAAHLILTAVNHRGGAMYRLFPSNQRFAVREAVFMEWMADDSEPDDVMSGGDLISFLSRVVGDRSRGAGGEE